MGYSVQQSIMQRPVMSAADDARASGKAARKSGYKPFQWMRQRHLPVLSILVCIGFLAAAAALVVGLLSGNYELVGLVFWVLPRLGFLALVVLLVRFVTTPETPPKRSSWNNRND